MDFAILGSSGKLGNLVLQKSEGHTPHLITRNILESEVRFMAFLESLLSHFVILDVSLPEATEQLFRYLERAKPEHKQKIRGVVVGTTGHAAQTQTLFQTVATSLPVCLVSNFSRGVFLLESLLKARTANGLTVTQLAQQLGFDLALHEIHHRHKKDAPSGTALTLAKAADIPTQKVSSMRVGEVVGEHSVVLSGPAEQLNLTHIAHTRELFAHGALSICKNIYERKPAPGFLEKENYLI